MSSQWSVYIWPANLQPDVFIGLSSQSIQPLIPPSIQQDISVLPWSACSLLLFLLDVFSLLFLISGFCVTFHSLLWEYVIFEVLLLPGYPESPSSPSLINSVQSTKQFSASLKIPRSTVASILQKLKNCGTTRTFPRAGPHTKLVKRSVCKETNGASGHLSIATFFFYQQKHVSLSCILTRKEHCWDLGLWMMFLWIGSGVWSISPLCRNTEVNGSRKKWKYPPPPEALPHGGCHFEILMVQLSEPQKRSMATYQPELTSQCEMWTGLNRRERTLWFCDSFHQKVRLWRLLPLWTQVLFITCWISVTVLSGLGLQWRHT